MNESLKKLLLLLSDGQFHSSKQLGKILAITRGTIWKLAKQCATWGLKIESIPNKGYRIPQGLNLLKKESILSLLSPIDRQLIEKIELFDSLPSTNDYLFQSIRTKTKMNAVCLTEKQTKGKGRQGRSWHSPFAKNIYLSLLWHFPQDLSELSGLSLAIAISVVEALKEYGVTEDLRIKWPNDVLFKNQKLAGILIELSAEANDCTSAVIGIGLNVNMTKEEGKTISQPWIELQRLTTKTVERNELTALLLSHLLKTVSLFEKEGLAGFIQRWKSLDLTSGMPVSVITLSTQIEGIGRGIDERGHFLLETRPGVVKNFSSGEVSVRLKN